MYSTQYIQLSAFEDAEENLDASVSDDSKSEAAQDLSTTLVDNDDVHSESLNNPDTSTSTPTAPPRRKLRASHAKLHRSASTSNLRDEGVKKFMNFLDKVHPSPKESLNSTEEHSDTDT